MKKKILLILLCLFLCGCQNQTAPTKILSQPVKFLFFSIETCSDCQAFKKNAIPYLEKTFGDMITIEVYDLDDDATVPIYDGVIDSLDGFDDALYGNGPFYAVEGYFAKLGYTSGDEEELANDIEKVVRHEELGYELEAYRYVYKEIE